MILTDAAARPVIAHRGDSVHAPENTLESFAHALALGVDALEFDCRVTADGVPVVIHDALLDRTTDARGPVRARRAVDLQAIDAGARFSLDGGRTTPFRDRGVRIPTLDEVLARFPEVPVLIEVKEVEACAAVRAVLDRHGAVRRAAVASFLDAAAAYFRTTPYPTGAARGDVARLLATAWTGFVRRPPYQLASIPPAYGGVRLPLGQFARVLRRFGVPVHVWTVDRGEEAQALWAVGVAGIVSNDPGEILRARGGVPA